MSPCPCGMSDAEHAAHYGTVVGALLTGVTLPGGSFPTDFVVRSAVAAAHYGRLALNREEYVVICRDDGAYVLTTRQVFPTHAEAATYARTVNASREPLVVSGRFRALRFDGEAP